jgi:hypothetical protein
MTAIDTHDLARSPWVEWLGRAGLVAKGIVYGLIGALALAIPLGLGGKTTDRHGALRTVAEAPLGELMLLALAVGLAGYAIWRLVEAFLDREDEGWSPKGIAKRIGYLGRGAVYAGSAFYAFAIAVGFGGGGGGNEQKETANVLELPGGRWLVGVVGLAFAGAGAYNLYRSGTRKFRKHLHEDEMGGTERRWVTVAGVAGHAARGVVFALIGVFLVKAAWQYDPHEAIGIDGALRKLAQHAYGEILLGGVAAGLLAYGLYCLVQARYREL